MASRSIKELREELSRLLGEQIASLKGERFGGLSPSEMRQHEERLKRIREVSADYLAASEENCRLREQFRLKRSTLMPKPICFGPCF